MFLSQILAIAFGGAVGSAARFVVAYKINQLLDTRFPYGVLVVNVLGCLLMGFLAVLLIERMTISSVWRVAILIGFLGGFTTFSSFTWETFNLFEQGEYLIALFNVLLSMTLCLLATVGGVFLGRGL